MEYLQTIFASLFSVTALFFLTKLIGKKQLSHFTMFDYVNGITIGSIAAEMTTELKDRPLEPFLAMVVYALVTFSISVITNKSLAIRRFFNGRSLVLFENEKFYIHNFNKAKININEFLMQARSSGYFTLTDIDVAILESNGNISFLPKSDSKPLTPKDVNLPIQQEKICPNLILDGKVLGRNLKAIGKDEKWLYGELKKQKIKSADDVFLAFLDNDNLTVYTQNRDGKTFDIFQ